jgi:hypothetical protein
MGGIVLLCAVKRFVRASFVLLISLFSITQYLRSQSLGSQTPQPDSSTHDTILSRARTAARAGNTTLVVPYGIYNYGEAGSLDDALKNTSAVVAQVTASATSYGESEIITWRKCRILEHLSTQPTKIEHSTPVGVPPSLLPLGSDEFLLPIVGGTVKIEGVQVTENNAELRMPPTSRKELLFVIFFDSPIGRLAGLNYGPNSAFWIDENHRIHPESTNGGSSLEEDLKLRTSGDLRTLRSISSAMAAQHGK